MHAAPRGGASMRLTFNVLCAAVIMVAPVAGLAVDVPIPAKVAVVKPAKLAKLVSKSATGFTLPSPGSPADPTTGGAELRFFDTAAAGAGSAVFVLDHSGWTGLGQPPGSAGYKYKGKDDVTGNACTSVQIKGSVIKAVCKGNQVTLTPTLRAAPRASSSRSPPAPRLRCGTAPSSAGVKEERCGGAEAQGRGRARRVPGRAADDDRHARSSGPHRPQRRRAAGTRQQHPRLAPRPRHSHS